MGAAAEMFELLELKHTITPKLVKRNFIVYKLELYITFWKKIVNDLQKLKSGQFYFCNDGVKPRINQVVELQELWDSCFSTDNKIKNKEFL